MATYSEKAWAFVRKTKTPFTAWDLARIAQVPYSFAGKYVFYLTKAGYLKIAGKKDKERIYRTVKITGTKPVKIDPNKRIVIDENTCEVYKIPITKRSEIQQRLWEEIISLKVFTSNDLYQKTFINKKTIGAYLRFLKKAGYIIEIGRESKYTRYKLEKYQEDYPELEKEILHIKIKNTLGRYQAIWDLITALPEFTVRDISKKLPDIHPESIRIYIKHLRRAGYLEVVKRIKHYGFLYKLVRNFGEKAPVLKLSRNKPPVVYDPNKNKTYPSIGD